MVVYFALVRASARARCVAATAKPFAGLFVSFSRRTERNRAGG